ncbi:Sestrin-1 [Geodia barretti]|uniref:Sestrin-1 n=1 Tax=Geodia barretti TaxID=519541 RepID=A0AA35S273_GEOBA|nr:Sestrin-1 [Geodia barretti]
MTENHVGMNGDFEEDEDFTECGRFVLLDSLARRDEQSRSLVMDRLERAFTRWREEEKEGGEEAKKLLREHVCRALALRSNAPFVDIRQRMGKLLEDAKLNKVPVPQPLFDGPTSFIPREEVVCYENGKNMAGELGAVQSQYEEAFVQEGRLSHVTQVLGYHPSYLPQFTKMHNFLMRGNGPYPCILGTTWPFWLQVVTNVPIWILFAPGRGGMHTSRPFMVSLQQKEFLANGGDPAWTEGGIQSLPAKMLNFLTVNKLLAHQPWLVTPVHMKNLLRGSDSWSVSELAHAVVVMAHFHSLSSFALSCGLTPEIDTLYEVMMTSLEGAEFPSAHPGCLTNPALGLGRRRENSGSESTQTDSGPISPEPPSSPTDSRTGQYMVQYYLSSTSGEGGNLGDTLREKLRMMDSVPSDEETEQQRDSQFMGAASIISTDDSVQKPKSPVFFPSDYSWDDHGYAFLNSLYPDICPLLDGRFGTSFSMTYKFVGKEKNIDTTNFREAIWFYIHSIKGIRHDDYQYRKVNQVLDISFKTFIRMVACFPEKVHVNIIAVDARMQAELIYAMRALMTFMKSQ